METGARNATYTRMLLDVMEKKEFYLQGLLDLTRQQEDLLKQAEFDELEFGRLVDDKDKVIKKIEELDNGFQAIYNRVQQEFAENKEAYREQILELQELITTITNLGVKISALEEKNREDLELCLQGKKKHIRQFKVGKQAADRYYKNMIGLQPEKSFFMDQKK